MCTTSFIPQGNRNRSKATVEFLETSLEFLEYHANAQSFFQSHMHFISMAQLNQILNESPKVLAPPLA